MNKTEQKQAYIRPEVRQYAIDNESEILAHSPNVQPGGGGGSITVVPPTEDDDDDEISGAKKFDLWGEEEE